MTKMINPNVMSSPPLSAQVLGASPTMSATVMPASNVAVPQTGLIGSEQALMAGHNAAIGSLGQGYSQAQGYLQNMLGSLGTSTAPHVSATAGGSGSFNSSVNLNDTVSGIQKGIDKGMVGINQAFNEGVGAVQGYNQGEGAMKMQADLSGANGPEAQTAAYAAYQSSPAMQYQMDQMQKATERSAAARGGLLGGNVLTELQRNASGIASQDYQNQFNNLGQVAQAGLGAALQIAGLKGNQAATQAGLVGQAAGIQGNLAAQSMAIQGNRENAILGIRADATNRLADLAQSAGLNTAGLYTGTAQQLSQGRTQAGQAIAQNANQAASNISNMLAQSGVAVSDMMAKDISTVTDMIYQSGMQDKIDSQQLAAILANISGGQASTVAQGYSDIGAANAAGTLGMNSAIQSGIEQAIGGGK